MRQQHEKQNTPNFTQVPNWILDKPGANFDPYEFMIICIIARKTYGWHKTIDAISLSQLMDETRFSKNTIIKSIKSLIQKGFITKLQGHVANRYAIIGSASDEQGVVHDVNREPPKVVHQVNTQKKVLNKNINKEETKEEIMAQIESGIRECELKERSLDNIPEPDWTPQEGFKEPAAWDDPFPSQVYELFVKYGSTLSRTSRLEAEIDELRKIADLSQTEEKIRQFREKQKSENWFSSRKLTLRNLLHYWNDLGEDTPQDDISYPVSPFAGLEALRDT